MRARLFSRLIALFLKKENVGRFAVLHRLAVCRLQRAAQRDVGAGVELDHRSVANRLRQSRSLRRAAARIRAANDLSPHAAVRLHAAIVRRLVVVARSRTPATGVSSALLQSRLLLSF